MVKIVEIFPKVLKEMASAGATSTGGVSGVGSMIFKKKKKKVIKR